MSPDAHNPYLSPTFVRAALARLDMRPTRAMGQNFLIDPEPLAQIVAAAELTPSDTAIEVGPGLGVLTWELLQRVARLISVELDKRLAARLQTEFTQPAFTLVQSDVLRQAPADLLAAAGLPVQSPYKLVANLPYAITQPVLRHFLEAGAAPTLAVVLVQWEVAERICAGPGDLSMLAHAIQYYAEAEIIARVPARSFSPAPAVDSAILRLRRRAAPPVATPDSATLFRVIKAAFLQTRKQLGNSLPGGLAALGIPIARTDALAALEAAGIDPKRRAETVTLAEWAALATALGPLSGKPSAH